MRRNHFSSCCVRQIMVSHGAFCSPLYTFFLAIPVMFGASLLKLMKFGFDFTGTQLAVLLVGMVTAFAVSVLAIKFLMGYIKKHDFSAFGWYRFGRGLVVLLWSLLA